MLEVEEHLDASLLAEVVPALLDQHDALRLRFIRNGESWEQVIETVDTTGEVFTIVDVQDLEPEAQLGRSKRKAARIQRSFDLSRGPLIKLALFETGAGKTKRLLIVIHHLVTDGVSWRILLADLERLTARHKVMSKLIWDLRPRRIRSGRSSWPATRKK